jgi:hypothetical protein
LRRVIGLIIVLFGASIALAPLISTLVLFGIADRGYLGLLAIRFLFALLIIAWGVSLSKGKWVLKHTSTVPYDGPPKPKNGLPEL